MVVNLYFYNVAGYTVIVVNYIFMKGSHLSFAATLMF